jgi:hypothetical protein
MVIEIKAYKNEITGKIYENRYKAIESEEKTRKKQEKEEVKQTAENIATELGFDNFREVLNYLAENEDKVKRIGVKMRINALMNRGVETFGLADVQEGLKVLIEAAMKEIENISYKVIIKLDNKIVEEVETKEVDKVNYKDYNPTKMYYKGEHKEKDSFVKEYVSYPKKTVVPLYEALIENDVENFDDFVEDVEDLYSDYQEELSNEDKYYALVNAGVDNWDGYEEAIELAEDNNEDWNDLSAEDKYIYLSNAGVDNWAYYSEALSPEVDFNDVSANIIEKIFSEYEKDYAEKWKNYQKMKFKLHGIESTL